MFWVIGEEIPVVVQVADELERLDPLASGSVSPLETSVPNGLPALLSAWISIQMSALVRVVPSFMTSIVAVRDDPMIAFHWAIGNDSKASVV